MKHAYVCLVWKAAGGAERSTELSFSEELEFSGEIQALYFHKTYEETHGFFPTWNLSCRYFLLSLELSSFCLSLPVAWQVALLGKGSPVPITAARGVLSSHRWHLQNQLLGTWFPLTQIKGIANNKAAADNDFNQSLHFYLESLGYGIEKTAILEASEETHRQAENHHFLGYIFKIVWVFVEVSGEIGMVRTYLKKGNKLV